MKLFVNQTSPYARKVRIVVRELGLVPELIDVDPWNDPAELLAISPLSKVPVLVTGEGLVLTESDTIARYLAERAASARLLPRDTSAQAEVCARMALLQGMIDAAFDAVIEKRRPASMQWPEWVARQQRAVMRGLVLVAQWPMPAHRFDLGDIGLACLLGYLDFRHPAIDWREDYPHLGAWFDIVSERPAVAATHPEIALV